MEFKDIQTLIKLIQKSNLTEFKMKDGDFELSIRTKKYGKNKVERIVHSSQPMMHMQAPASLPIQESVAPVAPASPTTPAVTEPEVNSNLIEIKSPIVGTFYRSSAPDKPPYVKVGDVISEGDTVCIVEAMKLFNEIESEVSGKIVKVLIEDAQPVEYDQVLFLVDPQG